MNQQLVEAVKQLPLNPLIDPAPVSWWPPAIGWWLLLLILIVSGLLLWFIGYKRYLQPALQLKRQRKRVREALQPHLQNPGPAAATSINMILKAHLLKLGHHRCKTLTGSAWLEYLVRTAQLQPREASALAPLGEASYRPRSAGDSTSDDRSFNKTVLLLTRRLAPVRTETTEAGGEPNG